MEDVTTNAPEVIEEQPESQTTAAEPSVAELHKAEPKSEKPKVVPMARLDKEIQKRKELEARLAEYESAGDDSDDGEAKVEKLAQEISQIKEKEKKAHLEATFMKHLNTALDNAPEYKDVVNVEVIRALAFNPSNADKTYRQLLEEAYGNAIVGRRTIEATTPRGGAKDTKVDFDRAKTDGEYRRGLLADPDLKRQYNEGLTKRVFG